MHTLGHCGRGPNVQMNDVVHEKMTPARAAELLRQQTGDTAGDSL